MNTIHETDWDCSTSLPEISENNFQVTFLIHRYSAWSVRPRNITVTFIFPDIGISYFLGGGGGSIFLSSSISLVIQFNLHKQYVLACLQNSTWTYFLSPTCMDQQVFPIFLLNTSHRWAQQPPTTTKTKKRNNRTKNIPAFHPIHWFLSQMDQWRASSSWWLSWQCGHPAGPVHRRWLTGCWSQCPCKGQSWNAWLPSLPSSWPGPGGSRVIGG